VSLPRAVWTTAPSGRAVQIWAEDDEVDVDVSDLTPPPSRAIITPIDEAALADLLQRTRLA
jgi:hypothetical protein